MPGYSFTGEIIGGEPERILTVESAAIAYENGRAYAERIGRGNRPPGERGGPGPGGGNREAPAPVEDGPPERVDVEAVPYWRNMVRVLSGLEPGDRLKAQAEEAGGFSPTRRGGAMIRVGR